MLEKYFTNGVFGELEYREIGRPKKSLIVVIFWSCLALYVTVKLLVTFSVMSSWKGVAIFMAVLAAVTLIMQILVRSSESERSNLPELPFHDPMKKALINTI